MATRAVEPRSRRYDPAETRQRVLEAANLLFSTKGFAATGTADIARAADVSEGSIFYHFGSKKNLLVDIGRMYGERMIAVAQADDPIENLDASDIIRRCVDFCIEHREWKTLTGEECPEGKPKAMRMAEAEPFYLASREVMVAWIREHLTAAFAKHGGGAGINLSCAANFIYVVVGEAIQEVLAAAEADRAAITDEAIRFVRAASGYAAA